MTNIFGSPGQHTLVIGPEASYASYIASTAAFDIAADGKSFVIFLVETLVERDTFTERAIQHRRARQMPIGQHMNFRCVDISHYSTAEALVAAMRVEIGHGYDVLIIHDRTAKLLPTTPNHISLVKGNALAAALGARLVTVAHYGPEGRPVPNLKAYPCSRVLHCRPHARVMKSTLHPIKGAGDKPIDFIGLRHGIQGLTFDRETIEEQVA